MVGILSTVVSLQTCKQCFKRMANQNPTGRSLVSRGLSANHTCHFQSSWTSSLISSLPPGSNPATRPPLSPFPDRSTRVALQFIIPRSTNGIPPFRLVLSHGPFLLLRLRGQSHRHRRKDRYRRFRKDRLRRRCENWGCCSAPRRASRPLPVIAGGNSQVSFCQ